MNGYQRFTHVHLLVRWPACNPNEPLRAVVIREVKTTLVVNLPNEAPFQRVTHPAQYSARKSALSPDQPCVAWPLRARPRPVRFVRIARDHLLVLWTSPCVL